MPSSSAFSAGSSSRAVMGTVSDSRHCGCSSICPGLPPAPRHFHTAQNSLPHTSQEGKMCPAHHNPSNTNRHCQRCENVASRLCGKAPCSPQRHFPGGTREVPGPHHCCTAPLELLCPWNSLPGMEGFKDQDRIVLCGHFITRVWPFPPPFPSRSGCSCTALWAPGLFPSPPRPPGSPGALCVGQYWASKESPEVLGAPRLPQLCPEPPPLPFPLVPWQRCCGSPALPSTAPCPWQDGESP